MPSPSGGSDQPRSTVEKDRGDDKDDTDKAAKDKGEKRSEKTEKSEKSEKERSQKSEKDKDKDREKTEKADKSERGEKSARAEKSDKTEKSSKESKSGSSTTATASRMTATTRTSSAPVKAGLSDEVLNQVAQAKFEAQEERLRDVARHTMALLRDYSKLSVADCTKKVGEIRKYLMKYEMQYVRVTELQEKRRKVEIEHLDAEAKRCRDEADKEAEKIVELHEVLGSERQRRKRYEGYEALASEVNKKKSRTQLHSEIDATTAEIARIRQQRTDLEELIDQRTRRAQLLRGAAAELAADLRTERASVGEIVGSGGGEADPAPAGPVEVIS